MALPEGTEGTIYYTVDGTDPRVYGSGEVSATAMEYTGPLTLDMSWGRRVHRSAAVRAPASEGTDETMLVEFLPPLVEEKLDDREYATSARDQVHRIFNAPPQDIRFHARVARVAESSEPLWVRRALRGRERGSTIVWYDRRAELGGIRIGRRQAVWDRRLASSVNVDVRTPAKGEGWIELCLSTRRPPDRDDSGVTEGNRHRLIDFVPWSTAAEEWIVAVTEAMKPAVRRGAKVSRTADA